MLSPGTTLPNWSTTSAVSGSVSSAVIVAVRGVTTKLTGAPGVTVTVSSAQMTPKQAVMV